MDLTKTKMQNLIEDRKKQVEMARNLLNTLRQQKEGARENLERKVSSLLENGNLTVDKLGSPVLVDALRETTQALNSTLLCLEAQGKLLDILLRDFTSMINQVQQMSDGLFSVSINAEAVGRILLDKSVLTQEELSEKQHLVVKEARDNIVKSQQTAQSEHAEHNPDQDALQV